MLSNQNYVICCIEIINATNIAAVGLNYNTVSRINLIDSTFGKLIYQISCKHIFIKN